MTTFIFIRHGEPRYDEVVARGFKNQGYDLGKLTERGEAQAAKVALDDRLKGATLIISSPYTRALQTAAIISRITQIPLTVENDLHEWLPDSTFSARDDLEFAYPEFIQARGMRTPNSQFHWEALDVVNSRSKKAIKSYLNHEKVLVVCHGIVMTSFTHIDDVIEHCGIREITVDETFFE